MISSRLEIIDSTLVTLKSKMYSVNGTPKEERKNGTTIIKSSKNDD